MGPGGGTRPSCRHAAVGHGSITPYYELIASLALIPTAQLQVLESQQVQDNVHRLPVEGGSSDPAMQAASTLERMIDGMQELTLQVTHWQSKILGDGPRVQVHLGSALHGCLISNWRLPGRPSNIILALA